MSKKTTPAKSSTRKPAQPAGKGKSPPRKKAANSQEGTRSKTPPPLSPEAYERKKQTERARQAAKSAAGRELGELPPVANPPRRASCERDLQLYLETYFAEDFPLTWSPDQLKLIKAIEAKILSGGLKAIGMPRGSGKTTIIERAIIWAATYGHQPYAALLGSNMDAAKENLEAIKTILETNELLEADFPEVCLPIQEIGGLNNRCNGQTYQGERTRIRWGLTKIILPTIPGSKASGVIIQAAGILSRVRGMKHKTPDGTFRPTVCLIDDPQTDASARSDGQVKKRMNVMTGAVLGLAGPGIKISGLAAVTVIRPGDVADQILDRDAHPEWDGLRTKMLYGDPKHQDLIDQYWDRRADEMRRKDGTFADTTAWYRSHQKKIESGLKAAWEQRHNPDEISAIQHALNLIQDRGRSIFDAEYQNEPKAESTGDDWHIPADEIATKLNSLARGVVPLWAEKLTAFIDIQQRLLYFAVAAWGAGRGAIIDYGCWPEQKSRDHVYRDVRYTLARQYPKRGVKGAIKAGLTDLVAQLLERDWKREDKLPMRVGQLGIDAGNWTSEVHEFTRAHKMAALILPCKGKGITADKSPISEWRKKPTEQIGEEWILSPQPKHASRLLTFDTNYWKRQLFLGLSTPFGDPQDLSLFGTDKRTHEMIAAHCHAETYTKTEGHGRTVYVFAEKPGRPDNHLFDCLTGCMVMQLHGLVRRVVRRGPRKAQSLAT